MREALGQRAAARAPSLRGARDAVEEQQQRAVPAAAVGDAVAVQV